MWYNEITFEGKSIGNKPKKSFFKKLKEKVDNKKLEWYITQRHWKKGAENILKYLIKKVVKNFKKKLTTTKRFGILLMQPRKKASWKQEMIFEN